MMLATFGTASPPMAAGAMLLLYQFVMAMFVGFGPLFILSLMFEQTKSFFQRWLF
jgi:type IV secretion system protein VirB6